MWRSLSRNGFGFINSFDGLLCKDAESISNLDHSPALIIASDYSGQQKGSDFEAYALLIIGAQGWSQWEISRLEIRKLFKVGKRRVSFKGLTDKRKRNMLQAWLTAADQLAGLCVTILVSKNIKSVFVDDGEFDFDDPNLQLYSHFKNKTHVFEKLLRIAHFVSFFVAGLSRPGQDVLWFTDQDDIAANDDYVIRLTETWGNILSHYLLHDLRHIRCGTTKCDSGDLQIEDLASIPDLVAGASVELVNRLGSMLSSKLMVPQPRELSQKSKIISAWLINSRVPLKKLVYLIEEEHESRALSVKHVGLHNTAVLTG
jgi:hypothetical protein